MRFKHSLVALGVAGALGLALPAAAQSNAGALSEDDFSALDTNNDGAISRSEWRQSSKTGPAYGGQQGASGGASAGQRQQQQGQEQGSHGVRFRGSALRGPIVVGRRPGACAKPLPAARVTRVHGVNLGLIRGG